ncbi:TMEM43 family protein [Geminicoccaceae bacterium 1502E]|nr:TMEM43 family protein [Geminicoccaceae bacterium 1502E]
MGASGWLLVAGEIRSATRTADLRAAAAGLHAVDPQAPGGEAAGAVFVQGATVVEQPPRDPLLGVSAHALRLDRLVEMYQWREHREGTGDNKTVAYEPVWSAALIDSSRFDQRLAHGNPGSMAIPRASFAAPEARLGRLLLSPEVLAELPATMAVPAPAGALAGQAGRRFRKAGDWLHTGDAQDPAIGDLRLRFLAVPAQEISVVAGLESGRLVPWRTPGGRTVALAAAGRQEAGELLGRAQREDWLGAWQARAGGGFLAFVAMLLLRAGLGVEGRSPGTAIAGAALMAGAFALACVAGGWLLFRPLASGGLLLAAAGAAMAAGLLLARGRARGPSG